MFDIYIICEDGFENIYAEGKAVGFQFKCRLPYYRGLGISMIEDLDVVVDSEPVRREAIKVNLHGKTYTLDEMEKVYDVCWEFGEKGIVIVEKPGGLSAGEHTIQVTPHLRISYLPFILTGNGSKTLMLAA